MIARNARKSGAAELCGLGAVGEFREFRTRFETKGRYRDYMAAIPTYVITTALPAFRGLKYLLGYR